MSGMPRKHAIIYIPGLGDSRISGQQRAVNAWKVQDVEPNVFQMNWMDGEPFDPKLKRLLLKIDELLGEGKIVSLISASAGSSAALNAYAKRQDRINGLVSICGKLQGFNSVNSTVYGRNPAFQQSMEMLPESEKLLDMSSRHRILSLHPIADESVPIADTKLAGTVPRTMPVAGHFFGIAYGLTVGSFASIKFLKRLAA
jgi:pimeloyl-ACP methyl ester carboxylesterase